MVAVDELSDIAKLTSIIFNRNVEKLIKEKHSAQHDQKQELRRFPVCSFYCENLDCSPVLHRGPSARRRRHRRQGWIQAGSSVLTEDLISSVCLCTP